MSTTKMRVILYSALETMEADGLALESAAHVLLVLGVPIQDVAEATGLRKEMISFKRRLLKTGPRAKYVA